MTDHFESFSKFSVELRKASVPEPQNGSGGVSNAEHGNDRPRGLEVNYDRVLSEKGCESMIEIRSKIDSPRRARRTQRIGSYSFNRLKFCVLCVIRGHFVIKAKKTNSFTFSPGIGAPLKLPLGFAGFRIVHFMDDGMPVCNQLFNRR